MKKWSIRIGVILLWFITIVYAYGLGGLAGMYRPDRVKYSSALALDLLMLLGGKACDEDDTRTCGFTNIEGKEPADCSPYAAGDPRRAVLFVFGQSNSANSGNAAYTPHNEVINFNPHDGQCYRAADPLLGPDGEGGSVWGLVADGLIDQGSYDSVLIVPFGIGGTPIDRWTEGGDLHARIEHSAAQILAQGIRPSHVLWHQGEADAAGDTSGQEYTQMFGAMVTALRGYDVDAPVYPAVATICANEGSPEIRQAQLDLPNTVQNTFAGANTDTLVDSHLRFDACHFSAEGMRAHARLWVEAISASRKN